MYFSASITDRDLSSYSQFFRNNISQFANIIEQNDMKALKKMMKKPRIAKNLDLVRSGILTAFHENNCEALKILSSSPLSDLFEAEFFHCVILSPKVDFLRTLLNDKRVDVNQVVGSVTPLMTACSGETLERVYQTNHPDIDVNAKDETPRMEDCRVEIVRELLQHPKIDVNAQDKSECSALAYALQDGPEDIVKMLINHKDMTQSNIQESLLVGMRGLSHQKSLLVGRRGLSHQKSLLVGRRGLSREYGFIDLELLNILMKNNFENEFILKNLASERFEFHEHLQSWISEELEMKLREEYYNDNIDVSEESVCNKAFGFSLEILQAYILKCKCAYCSGTRHIKQQNYLDDDFDFSDHDSGYKCFKNCGLSSKDPKAKCILETKVPVLFENRTMAYDLIDFIYSPLPAIYQDILLNGGHENDLDDIINGIITVQELGKESESKDKVENVSDENIGSSEVIDKSSLCWSCSSTSVKLYKCSGCRKARYCSDKCIGNDWKEHANFCVKMQQKRKNKKSLSRDI